MDFTSNEQEIVDYLMQFTTKESKALHIPGNQNGHYGKSLEITGKRQTKSIRYFVRQFELAILKILFLS